MDSPTSAVSSVRLTARPLRSSRRSSARWIDLHPVHPVRQRHVGDNVVRRIVGRPDATTPRPRRVRTCRARCPLHAHWLDGEPISEISSMSGVVDRTRHFVVDDVPVVTGLLSIADAHVCTNPSIGRGMTLGLMHTVVMRDAVRTHIDSPVELAKAFDAATVTEIDPWHIATRDLDRARIAVMEAAAEGREIEPGPAETIGSRCLPRPVRRAVRAMVRGDPAMPRFPDRRAVARRCPRPRPGRHGRRGTDTDPRTRSRTSPGVRP